VTAAARYHADVELDDSTTTRERLAKSRKVISDKVESGTSVYGLSTGFGGSGGLPTSSHFTPLTYYDKQLILGLTNHFFLVMLYFSTSILVFFLPIPSLSMFYLYWIPTVLPPCPNLGLGKSSHTYAFSQLNVLKGCNAYSNEFAHSWSLRRQVRFVANYLIYSIHYLFSHLDWSSSRR
jgi:Aromatic amino acid lyase